MALQPITWASESTTTMSAHEARESVSRAILGMRGARQGAPGWLQFLLGSAAWLRVWGLWTPRAYTHLPLVVDATVTDSGSERRVRLDFRSDEGWYLVRLGRVEGAYHRRFREVTAAVEARLSQAG